MSIVSTNKYSIFDKLDEKQIQNADSQVKEKMVYRYKDNDELTFVGLKWIILEMANKDMPLEIEDSKVTLEKDDPDNKQFWFWRANVKVRNQGTNYPSQGLAECAYLDENGNYDPFARTTAHSKAERNSWRKQVPEQKIIALLKAVGPDAVHEVKEPDLKLCTCETPEPNKLKTACTNCKGAFNAYQRKQLGIDN